ncbi:MAG: hypothetical protein MJ105_05370 [Lachnospiraceae bacterium]|nr:hypothetical protein [Lachnospiraceae bacterium]
MKKRLVVFVLSAMTVFTFSGCGNKNWYAETGSVNGSGEEKETTVAEEKETAMVDEKEQELIDYINEQAETLGGIFAVDDTNIAGMFNEYDRNVEILSIKYDKNEDNNRAKVALQFNYTDEFGDVRASGEVNHIFLYSDSRGWYYDCREENTYFTNPDGSVTVTPNY